MGVAGIEIDRTHSASDCGGCDQAIEKDEKFFGKSARTLKAVVSLDLLLLKSSSGDTTQSMMHGVPRFGPNRALTLRQSSEAGSARPRGRLTVQGDNMGATKLHPTV